MSTKYKGLPDIDTAPDVFETSDEPETVLRPSDNGFEDDEHVIKPVSTLIDSSGLPERRKAERVFGRGTRRADPSKLTFRPQLPLLSGRDSGSSDDEEYIPKETPAARLRRLKAELAEVEADLRASSSKTPTSATTQEAGQDGKRKSVLPPRPPVDLVGELTGLKERLEAVEVGGVRGPATESDWKARLERLSEKPSAEGSKTGEVSSASRPEAGLSDIDKRLASLEDLVGPGDSSIESTSSLLATLNKHDHLLALLTQPRHLDAISRRVKLLLVDLDRAAAAARRQGPNAPVSQPPADKTVNLTSQDYASLQTLFALLPRLDPLLPIIPPLLARLQSLSGLHASASEVLAGLSKLKESEKRSGEEVKELVGIVEGVQSGLDDASKAILANWEGVERRMKDLESRVKALDS